ncbi:MAG: DMT family transporter [Pseudomonadota bacterium]
MFFIAMLCFDAMGLIIKYLSQGYSAAELSAYRNFFGLIPSLIALWWAKEWRAAGANWRLRQWRLAVLRGVCITFAQFSFYLSLALMSFATAQTISYAVALFTVAFAVPVLSERVGPVRWAAVGVGFAGVVWVMRPGADAFSWVAVLPLIAAALYAMAGVLSRRFDEEAPSALVNIWSTGVSTIGSVALVFALGGFREIASMEDLAFIVAMGCFGGCAVLCWVVAHRQTEPANLAPFNYFGIPLAFWLGWIFFDEAPWSDLFPGAILIVAGGLIILWRERRAPKAK